MPYSIIKVPKGYYVISTITGHKHSKQPLTLEKAKTQLRIINNSLKQEKGGLIGVIPDDKLISSKLKSSYTRRANEIIKLLSFKNKPPTIISVNSVVGSFSFSLYPYYGDIDIDNKILLNTNYSDGLNIYCNHLQNLAIKLKNNNKGFIFSDLKAGLYENGDGIHWKLDDIIEGKKDNLLLINSLKTGLCKIDVIIPYYGRYMEVSMIYSVKTLDGYIGRPMISIGDIKEQIKHNFFELVKDGSYFKAMKRLYSLSRLNKDIKTIKKIVPILISNLSKLSNIRADLETIKLILEKNKIPNINYINIEFNKIKDTVSSILDINIKTENFNMALENLYTYLKNRDIEKSIILIDSINNSIYNQINKETLLYINTNNLNIL